SLPLKASGYSKPKSFLFGMVSGIVEPIAALVTILCSQFVIEYLPYFLSFAAGAMMYVVIEELIPESQNGQHSNLGTVGAAIGFVVMMVLDVMLG
ncbi:MAG: ZIP family metal transporter, partial [Longicatena sp.]|nr:ZIP family metal transporter [Longicatena sp.]